MTTNLAPSSLSPKSGLTAFVLCFFFGAFGFHRFYVGKVGTGILMLLTAGGLGLWTLYDLFSIVCKNFTDKQGSYLEVAHNPSAAKKVTLTVATLFILFVGGMIVMFSMVFGKMADVAQAELAALRAGDVEQAYTYTSTEFQKAVSIEDFEKFVTHYPALKDNTSASFPDRNMHDNLGNLNGTLSLPNGKSIPITIHLIKENDQWKIVEIILNPRE